MTADRDMKPDKREIQKHLRTWPKGPASGHESDRDVAERIVRPAYLRALLEEAAAEAGATAAQILGQSTARRIVCARWVMYARAYERGYSFAQIAMAYGRDPTTVRHAVISSRSNVAQPWRVIPEKQVIPQAMSAEPDKSAC